METNRNSLFDRVQFFSVYISSLALLEKCSVFSVQVHNKKRRRSTSRGSSTAQQQDKIKCALCPCPIYVLPAFPFTNKLTNKCIDDDEVSQTHTGLTLSLLFSRIHSLFYKRKLTISTSSCKLTNKKKDLFFLPTFFSWLTSFFLSRLRIFVVKVYYHTCLARAWWMTMMRKRTSFNVCYILIILLTSRKKILGLSTYVVAKVWIKYFKIFCSLSYGECITMTDKFGFPFCVYLADYYFTCAFGTKTSSISEGLPTCKRQIFFSSFFLHFWDIQIQTLEIHRSHVPLLQHFVIKTEKKNWERRTWNFIFPIPILLFLERSY